MTKLSLFFLFQEGILGLVIEEVVGLFLNLVFISRRFLFIGGIFIAFLVRNVYDIPMEIYFILSAIRISCLFLSPHHRSLVSPLDILDDNGMFCFLLSGRGH